MSELTSRYKDRRKRLMEQIPSGDIILLDSSGTAPNPVLADRNLTYLTGYREKDAFLLLAPDGIRVERRQSRNTAEMMRGFLVHEVLFVQGRNWEASFMDGASATLDEIKEETGVDRVYPLFELNSVVASALMSTNALWLNTPETPDIDQPLSSYLRYVEKLRHRFYWLPFHNIARKIHQMRFVKDDYEVSCLRDAFEIQTKIFEQIMKTLKPGVNESMGHAILDYEIAKLGARYGSMGYEDYDESIIVGSGTNSMIPHYMDNSRVIEDGDLVLIDACCSSDGYYADITRTFPANGKFTPRQREIYSIVLEAQYTAIETYKPGSTIHEAQLAVYDVFKKHGIDKYSFGGCCHPVGLTIHDPHGRTSDDRFVPLEPGVVVVIEPFVIMTEDGFGVRIEDGVLITDDGHEVLAAPPKEIDELEALLSE